MTNRFGVVLHNELMRWAAAEGVSETVIAAVLLLHEQNVGEIVPKLSVSELEQVIKLVGRSPRIYPPGTLDALKGRRPTPALAPVASTSTSTVVSNQPAARIKPDAEDMRRAQARRLAGLRVRAPQTGSERERAVTSWLGRRSPWRALVVRGIGAPRPVIGWYHKLRLGTGVQVREAEAR